ncbi:MAG: trigger factor [Lachnospiraceae bacterium]|nr:trigger factor [Lachnospiraceae bacterium]
MSVQVEKLEKSTAKLTIEVTAEKFEEGLEKAYQKNKNRFNIQGFRRGKAPRKFVEKMYGAEILYEDAANAIIPEAYEEAYKEVKDQLDIFSRPEIDVTQIEKGKPFIFTAKVALNPAVTLGAYKGVEIDKVETEVTEAEIDDAIKKVQESNSRTVDVTDRAVEDGDTAVIDFEGFVDGEAFEGGKGNDYSLVIGSHSFIDTFEDQIIGHSIGDEFEVNVTFPAEYGVSDLAGKPAVFKVTVKAIKRKELPEVDDDFASEVSDFETVAEYRESLRKDLTEKKAKEAADAKEDAAVRKAIEACEVELDELHIKDMVRTMMDETAANFRQQGISMDMYYQYTGTTEEDLKKQLEPRAEERIKSREVLKAVAEAEKIEVSDADIEAEITEMAGKFNMEPDKVKSMLGEEGKKNLTEDLKVRKAAKFIAANAVEK